MKIHKHLLGLLLAAAALTLVSTPALAVTEVLTFEGLQNDEPIDNFYNGGAGGLGSTGGPNYGINFTADSLALISDQDGGTGNFSNNPSGDTVAFFEAGAGDTMNVANGFTTGFSFYYAASFAGSVNVYGGLNGTGSLLATLALPTTTTPYSVFSPIGVTFAGTAESAIFSGSANYIAFDNITLGSATAGVPEPGPTAALLLGAAVSALGFLKRKLA